MPRMHTRVKRLLGLNTKRSHKLRPSAKKGAKTFRTADKAKEYALKVLKLKEGSFDIVPAKKNKKFKIIKK